MAKRSMRRTANVFVGVFAAMLLASVLGCASTSKGPFDSDGMPRDKYLVGGGLQINWLAPQDGTAYVVVSAGGKRKIILTGAISEGEDVDFSLGDADPAEIENLLGAKLSETEVSLYFVPSLKKEAVQ